MHALRNGQAREGGEPVFKLELRANGVLGAEEYWTDALPRRLGQHRPIIQEKKRGEEQWSRLCAANDDPNPYPVSQSLPLRVSGDAKSRRQFNVEQFNDSSTSTIQRAPRSQIPPCRPRNQAGSL